MKFIQKRKNNMKKINLKITKIDIPIGGVRIPYNYETPFQLYLVKSGGYTFIAYKDDYDYVYHLHISDLNILENLEKK